MSTTELTAPWGTIAAAVQEAGPGAAVTVTATKLIVRVTPAGPDQGDASEFTLALPSEPMSAADAQRAVADELVSRGVDAGPVPLLVAIEETIDTNSVIERLAKLGRVIGRRTWFAYVYRGQAPPPVRKVDGHPVWLTTEIDSWQASSPGDGRPRTQRWPATSPRKPSKPAAGE